ncbi:MAG: alpha/beta hydrolase, partial [Nocardioides sp.]
MPTRRDTTEAPVIADELVAPAGNEVELCYQTFGDPTGEPLLLVMGLGGPMTWWDTEFCVMLASEGFYVVRYDNRDTGRSTRIRARVKRSHLVRAFGGRKVKAPYSMSDLAGDAVALM